LALWISQAFSVFAVHLINFTLVILIFDLSESAIMIGLLMVAISAPSVLLVAIAGAVSDRWNRQKILVTTNIIQAIAILGYFLVFDSIGGLLFVALINSSIAQFYIPTEAATLPTLVKDRELISANNLFTTTLYGGFIVGYAFAGPLVILFGKTFPFLLAALMLFCAALATTFLPSDEQQKESEINIKKAVRDIVSDIKEGVVYIKKNKKVFFPTLRFAFSITLLYIFLVLFPPYAKSVLGIGISDLSHIIIWPAGSGLLVASFLVESLTKKFGKSVMINFGLFICSAAMLLMSFYSNIAVFEKFFSFGSTEIGLLPIASILAFFLGFGATYILIPTQTQLQQATEGRLLGRVYSSIFLIANIANVPIVLFTGTLIDLLSAKIIVLILSILLLFISIKNCLISLWQKLIFSIICK